jgi:hypothetical protein
MSIQKVTAETEIKPGQWALERSAYSDSLFARPRRVVKASGQRIYLTDEKGIDDGLFVARKSVAYLCDTREQAEGMYQISERHHAAIQEARDAVHAESAARIACAIGDSA